MDKEKSPTWGGKRPGPHGPRPTGRKRRSYFATDAEDVKIKQFIKQLRNPSK